MSKRIVNLESKDSSIVTYQELENDFNHFEICYLSFCKAIEIIRSATYLNNYATKNSYKPKVAVLGLKLLCEDKEGAKIFAAKIKEGMFVENHEENSKDEYNVDDGHLPGYGFESN